MRLICLDCGRVIEPEKLVKQDDEDHGSCPRCGSLNHTQYIEAVHQKLIVEVPENYVHPMEQLARALFDRVQALTGWREVKVRLWFQLQNPLLGNVSPEYMLMNDRAQRLEKFIAEAEELSADVLESESQGCER